MTVLKLHAEPLKDVWLDAYGQLNEAYYLVPFANANWAFVEHFGVGVDYFERTGRAFYTLEAHLRYLKEVRAPARLEVESLVFRSDTKRIRLAHVMTAGGIERASFECILLHFDTREGRTAAMPADFQAALKRVEAAELPDWAGHGLSLEKR